MQAVILAGGLATRMHPYTQTVPKSLLDVHGRPFLAWQLEKLASCGFRDVVLCIGHLGEAIRQFAGDGSAFGLTLRYSFDGPNLLGTGGALRRALSLLDESFVVTYGDSYLPFDYGAPLVDLLAHPAADATMSVLHNDHRWDASNAEVASDYVVRYEKGGSDPRLTFIDYGAIAMRRSVCALLPADAFFDLSTLLARLASSKRLRAYTAPERFYEIGSASGLAELTNLLRPK
jgi:NDP-sugar pyrophosphorylase family protein